MKRQYERQEERSEKPCVEWVGNWPRIHCECKCFSIYNINDNDNIKMIIADANTSCFLTLGFGLIPLIWIAYFNVLNTINSFSIFINTL